MKQFKTYSQTTPEAARQWYAVDASTMPLGRLAVLIANKLIGKSKVTFTPHTDNGDFVVVVNASKIVVTGDKMTSKHYYRHSGYIGSLTDLRLEEMLEKHPEKVIQHAVEGMLPKNKLAPARLARLKIFAGPDHTHEAQKPMTMQRLSTQVHSESENQAKREEEEKPQVSLSKKETK